MHQNCAKLRAQLELHATTRTGLVKRGCLVFYSFSRFNAILFGSCFFMPEMENLIPTHH